MVRHSSLQPTRGYFVFMRDRCDERMSRFLKFRCDQVSSVLGAIDRVDIIIGIRMAHARGRVSRRITGLVPRLRRSDQLQIDFPALPGWADV